MKDEFRAVGISMSDRGKRTDEASEVLKAIWTTNPVEFDGTYYTIPKSVIKPKPVQQPHPPIYLAASTPRAMARVARHGDGWFPLGLPIDEWRRCSPLSGQWPTMAVAIPTGSKCRSGQT